jgi:hypothetical protein
MEPASRYAETIFGGRDKAALSLVLRLGELMRIMMQLQEEIAELAPSGRKPAGVEMPGTGD